VYAVDWQRGRVDFLLDGALIRTVEQAPGYPMQMMVAVFDFPAWSTGDDAHLVPALEVDRVTGSG
jgi:hypothetical protein